METTLDNLINVPLPQETATYKPVEHRALVDMLGEHLDKNNLSIQRERYSSNRWGTQMFAEYSLSLGDEEKTAAVGIRNSYDKSMAVGMCAGSQVVVCSNMMFNGDIVTQRKHTGSVSADIGELLDRLVESIPRIYRSVESDIEKFKTVPIDDTHASHIYGDLFMNHQVMDTDELNRAIRYWQKPTHGFGKDTLFDFYQTVNQALKGTHPSTALQRFTKLHDYLSEVAEDKSYTEVAEAEPFY